MKHIKVNWFFVSLVIIIGIFVYKPYLVDAMDVATATHSDGIKDKTPFYWAVGTVGGLIAITLTYVSFRKYKGDEKKRTKKDLNS